MYKQLRLARSQQMNPQPKSQSKYFINNSLRCCIQPKRVSVDIKLYLQLHKKLLRKAIIQQKFQQNMNDTGFNYQENRKGFVGNALRQSVYRRKFISQRSKRIISQDNKYQTSSHLQSHNEKYVTQPSVQQIYQRPLTGTLKPKKLNTISANSRRYKKRQNKNKTQNQFSRTNSIIKKVYNPQQSKVKIDI